MDKLLKKYEEIKKAIELAESNIDLNNILTELLIFSRKHKEPIITIKLELLIDIKRSEIRILNKIERSENRPKRVYLINNEPKEEIKKTYVLRYFCNNNKQCKVSQFKGDINDIDAYSHMKTQVIDNKNKVVIYDFRRL